MGFVQDIKEDAKREKKTLRDCQWCEKPRYLKKGQFYCCPSCRAAASAHARFAQLRVLEREKIAWLKERDDLVKEIATLRRQLKPV